MTKQPHSPAGSDQVIPWRESDYSMSHDNDSTKMTQRAPLSPLEKGLGQTAWVVAVVVALFLIAGFIKNGSGRGC